MSVVVTSRIRLARNHKSLPYPSRMNDAQRQQLYQTICGMLPSSRKNITDKSEMAALIEQHWVSPEIVATNGAVSLDIAESTSVMINEEDHLRIQAIQPGLALFSALDKCRALEQTMTIPYAYDQRLGFLTSCPSNLGAGLRAGVMLHLPALVQYRQLHPLIASLGKIGLVVRGFYGEGSDALGSYVQVSNRTSLGVPVSDILFRIEENVLAIAAQEDAARTKWYTSNKMAFEDKIYRAYGILSQARLLSYDDGLQLLSVLRMGVLAKLMDGITTQAIDELQLGPHTLIQRAGQKLSAGERDVFRAELVRNALKL